MKELVAIAALLAAALIASVADAQECQRLLDFETDHAGDPIAPGDDVTDAYAGWSVHIEQPADAQAVDVGGDQGPANAVGGTVVYVVHFEDPFCVRSLDVDRVYAGQGTVIPQCFDGSPVEQIAMPTEGTLHFGDLCGVGKLRIEFWAVDVNAPPVWDNLCLVHEPELPELGRTCGVDERSGFGAVVPGGGATLDGGAAAGCAACDDDGASDDGVAYALLLGLPFSLRPRRRAAS